MDENIRQWLEKLPPAKKQNAILLRNIILSTDKKITEAIKWRNLTFSIGKMSFAFIYTYPQVEYINMGFFCATSLNDPKGLFEGSGKGMRHIKVYEEKDIPVTQMRKWVKETLNLLKASSS